MKGEMLAPLPVDQAFIAKVEADGTVHACAEVKPRYMAPEIVPTLLREDGIAGTLFCVPGKPRAGVLVLGGSAGGLNEYNAALLAWFHDPRPRLFQLRAPSANALRASALSRRCSCRCPQPAAPPRTCPHPRIFSACPCCSFPSSTPFRTFALLAVDLTGAAPTTSPSVETRQHSC
jgi:hypothetical protein